MKYIAHTAHLQFFGLIAGMLSWILIMATAGMNEWRVWRVADESVITSGVAWVGIWRACFYSHVLSKLEHCQKIHISDPFVPSEILVAQVLIGLAMICGLVGNISAAQAMRLAYFSVKNRRNLRPIFVVAGALYMMAGTFCLVPVVMNMKAVVNNSTIDFPPEFYLPEAPVKQKVGSAIVVGMFASILMLASGLLLLCYRHIWHALSSEAPKDTRDPLHDRWTETTRAQTSGLANGDNHGRDNPAFHSEEAS